LERQDLILTREYVHSGAGVGGGQISGRSFQRTGLIHTQEFQS